MADEQNGVRHDIRYKWMATVIKKMKKSRREVSRPSRGLRKFCDLTRISFELTTCKCRFQDEKLLKSIDLTDE